MSAQLVECIPNFSEARRLDVVEKILITIREVSGIVILDHHSDLDHNRTVVTFIGNPKSVEEAAFQAIRCASSLIDLHHHTGAHPRIGATDVIPFVPISEISMQECVEMARRLGKRVGDELQIPIYLYEEAATRPERQNLENIRRGQFERLKEEIENNPERKPDFGPSKLGGSGATVIGARQPLIAFNVYLSTDEVPTAQKIAKAIRLSSGGYKAVKAMGILVDGKAQVSMNLTDFRQTPIARVVETVRREAARYGVNIHHTELVGLAPEEALIDAAVWYLQMDQFEHGQILEKRLFEAQRQISTQHNEDIPDFIDQLAAATPTPGGGSAAAYTASAAAALVTMVARLTVGKKKYANVEVEMWSVIEKAESLKEELRIGVDEDSAAFDTYLQAVRLPKDTAEQEAARSAAIQIATLDAARVPLKTTRKCLAVLEQAGIVATLGNLNAISDAGSAAILANAALTCAGLNVQINCKTIEDTHLVQPILDELMEIENKAKSSLIIVNNALLERAGLNTA